MHINIRCIFSFPFEMFELQRQNENAHNEIYECSLDSNDNIGVS